MKKGKIYTLVLVMGIFSLRGLAQNIAINANGALPNSNAILDISSNDKGILIPRLDSARRSALPNVQGLLVYDTVYRSFWYNDGQGWKNMTPANTNWSIYGNRGADNYSFIGTTDNTPFIVKVNNQLAGRIDHNGNNNGIGTSFGISTWGFMAGYSNTTGFDNTAIGAYSLYSNTSGGGNTATGAQSLQANLDGTYNTATGYSALMYHRTGHYNTAMGFSALRVDTSGDFNTAIGSYTLYRNKLGSYNTAIGYGALSSNGTGACNTAVGWGANGDSTTTNGTAIGFYAYVNASNKVRIGNSAVTVIEGQVPFTTPSDGRFKYQVQEDVKGLDFILQLRPVTYQFNVQKFDAQLTNHTAGKEPFKVPDAMQTAYNEAAAIRRSGFIAQEVEKAATTSGYNFSGLVKPKTADAYYSLSYESFVVPLVKAVQEQQEEIVDLKKQLNELKQLVQQLQQGAKQ